MSLTTTVVEHVRIARDTWRVRVNCPELARQIRPGQFVMLRLAGVNDPLLGRPLALYDTVLDAHGTPIGIDVVYLVTGKMTRRLADYRPGQSLQIWGPLGNGFPQPTARRLVFVAGGIGQTPFLAAARAALGQRPYGTSWNPVLEQPTPHVALCYGARAADYLAGLDDFRALGVDVHTITDDGSTGRRGLVTELLDEQLAAAPAAEVEVWTCGPEPMLAAVANVTAARGVRCLVSLETPMACGIGICFTCVARIRDEQGAWDYRRTCVEGPVFDARQVVFAD